MEPAIEDAGFDVARILLLRRAVQSLIRYGVHQREIAERAGIAPYQVRNFVNARTGNPRPSIARTIAPLYRCLSAYEQMVIPSECRALIREVKEAGAAARPPAHPWQRWLAEDMTLAASQFREVCREYAGDYLCFRYSSWAGHVVVSSLRIDEFDEEKGITEFRHLHATKEGKERSTSGYVFPLSHALFFIGCMEAKIGLETMVLIREQRSLLNGLIVVPSNRRPPIAANIVCRGVDQVEQDSLGIFPADDVLARMSATEIRAISNQTEERGVLQIW